jgi:hypothetical protein
MSRKGNCWDNAVVESFFATLKRELIVGETITARYQLREMITDYIDRYYNPEARSCVGIMQDYGWGFRSGIREGYAPAVREGICGCDSYRLPG